MWKRKEIQFREKMSFEKAIFELKVCIELLYNDAKNRTTKLAFMLSAQIMHCLINDIQCW